LRGHQGVVFSVQFAPAGDTLVSGSWDGTTRLWDPWTGRELTRFAGGFSRYSRDGRRILTRAGPKLILMELAPGNVCRTLAKSRFTPRERISGGGFSPDGRWLAFGTSAEGTTSGVRLWDLASGKESAFLPVSDTSDVRFHPTERELITAGRAGVFRWPLTPQADTLRIGPARRLRAQGWKGQIGLDREGRMLTVIEGGGARVLDLDNPTGDVRLLPHEAAGCAVTSPDGKWIATGTWNGFGVRVWDAQSGELVRTLVPDEHFSLLSLSPDGRWLVIRTGAGFELWETGSWQRARLLTSGPERDAPGWPSAFSPEGGVLAIALSESVVQLIDTATWRPLARLQPSDFDQITWLGFSPDGSQLAVSAGASGVRLWDLRLIRERLKEIGLDWELPPYPPAPRDDPAPPVRVEVDLGEFQAQRHFERARAHLDANRRAEAVAEYSKGLALAPDDASALNNLAWCLVSVSEPLPGDVARAIPLAQKAVGLAPKNAIYWNTLGVARCRAGEWAAAIDALQKAEQLEPDRHLGFNAFFLAVAHWQLGRAEVRDTGPSGGNPGPTVEQRARHQRAAREWFDRGVAWTEKNNPQDGELKRFRAEAAKELGQDLKSD
jgi:WD40 repeat protein